jgi:hypothetical protein
MHVIVPVKIRCGCGQKYAFDVYPQNGRMPLPIRCPVCGADGTAAANEIIALALQAQSPPLALRPRSLASTPPPAEVGAAQTAANLAPHLAQILKETVVQELAAQRRELLKAQEEAVLEIAAIIHRLDAVQAPMQDRLRAYEARIQEMEKELSALNEENRELLKLKIEMIRRQLEVERINNRLQFIPN